MNQDLCLNLWYKINPRVRCAFGNVLSWWPSLWVVTEPAVRSVQHLDNFFLTNSLAHCPFPAAGDISIIPTHLHYHCQLLHIGSRGSALCFLCPLLEQVTFLLVSAKLWCADGQSVGVARLSTASLCWWAKQMLLRIASCPPLSAGKTCLFVCCCCCCCFCVQNQWNWRLKTALHSPSYWEPEDENEERGGWGVRGLQRRWPPVMDQCVLPLHIVALPLLVSPRLLGSVISAV